MISRIKEVIDIFVTGKEEEETTTKFVIIDPASLELPKENEPDSHLIGLFAEIIEEKIA